MIKINNEVISQNTFPDGSALIKSFPYHETVPLYIEWCYSNDAELFTLQCLCDKYPNHKKYLIIHYIPHARVDRVKNKDDVFTLKTFANIINRMDFSGVEVLDAHSNVSLALIDKVIEQPATPFIINVICEMKGKKGEDNIALFFPDAGAMKRYTEYNHFLPVAYGEKKRDWSTGAILELKIHDAENIKDKDVLIIDDICSKGTTFYYAAKNLLAAGARSVSLYVTHCENTILDGKIFETDLIEHLYTTDSLVHKTELTNKENVTIMKRVDFYDIREITK